MITSMIKATELRIGNLFYPIQRNTEIHMPVEIPFQILSFSLFKVQVIKFPGVWSQSVPKEFDINDISPIPLTPEILESCGFEKKDDIVDYGAQGGFLTMPGYENDDYLIGINGKDFYFYLPPQDMGQNNVMLSTITYLHQLQNLYFALTGKELEIKELQHA